ncbi:delta-60 repeat domain-containing protein [Flaviaesturariibacter terrae]
MRKLWLPCLALLACALSHAQSYVRDNLFNYNLPTATINVRDLAIYSDKRILIAGEFHAYSSSLGYSKVLRLLPTGAPDPSFTCPAISGGRVNSIAIQPWDESIIIAGGFSSVNGVARSGIARLLPSGALDASFNPGSGISGSSYGELIIYTVAIRATAAASDRRIVAGGLFTYYNGTAVAGGNGGGLVQIKTDGTIDAAATPKVEGAVYHLALDDNGKILAGGEFYKVNGEDLWRFARINIDGSTDNTLWTGRWDGFNSTVTSVQVYRGQIYVGGFFTQYRGNNSGRLARLNSDGSYDATFAVGTGFTGSGGTALCTQGMEAKSVAFMSNGKVVVGGNFTAYQGNTVYRIARLNTNGSYDASFNTGTGFDQCVARLAFQGTDDSLVVGGFFNSFRDETQGTVMRLRKPPTPLLLSLGEAPATVPRHTLGGDAVYPNPFTVHLRVALPGRPDGAVTVCFLGSDGRDARRFNAYLRRGTVELQAGTVPAGTWLLQVTDARGELLLSAPLVKAAG